MGSTAFVGRGRFNRWAFCFPVAETPARPVRTASPEVSAPSAPSGRAALSRAATPRDDPAPTFDLRAAPPEGRCRGKFRPCGFPPCVNRVRLTPQNPRSTPVRSGHAPRSLHAAFRYPFPDLARLGRTYLFSVRQRSWGSGALRSIPRPRVLAFTPRIFARRSSAVHPHLPFADSPGTAAFCGRRSSLRTPSRGTGLKRPTAERTGPATGSCCRGQAKPNRI